MSIKDGSICKERYSCSYPDLFFLLSLLVQSERKDKLWERMTWYRLRVGLGISGQRYIVDGHSHHSLKLVSK